mmetsp:Transcript_41775/g.56943  ORF Transcript_41775/g.56943 Transcript_41775/m.56943 type:complete len:126 (-) Transcript_41775:312-689(-)
MDEVKSDEANITVNYKTGGLEKSTDFKANMTGTSTYENVLARQRMLKTTNNHAERSFMLNNRMNAGFSALPASTVTKNDFPEHDLATFRELNGDMVNHNKGKGEFTGYLRHAINKNMNLKATGHS